MSFVLAAVVGTTLPTLPVCSLRTGGLAAPGLATLAGWPSLCMGGSTGRGGGGREFTTRQSPPLRPELRKAQQSHPCCTLVTCRWRLPETPYGEPSLATSSGTMGPLVRRPVACVTAVQRLRQPACLQRRARQGCRQAVRQTGEDVLCSRDGPV